MSREVAIPIDWSGGLLTTLDPELVKPGYCVEHQNLDVSEGKALPRLGYGSSNFSSAPGSVQATRGLHIVRGFSGTTEVEEYLAFIKIGGTLKPYSVHVTTGVKTEITDDGTPVSLTDSEWYVEVFDGYAYCYTPGGEVYRHEIGVTTSWELADPGQPNQFTTGNYPWLTFERTESNSPTAGTAVSWAGFGGGGFTDNGGSGVCPTSHSAVSGSTEQINAANGGVNTYSWYDFTLDLNSTTAGIQDWTNATGIQVTISRTDLDRWQWADDLSQSDWPWAIGSGNARVWLSDNAGSPNTVELTGAVQTIVDELGDYYYRFLLTIPVASRGATWSDSRRLRFLLPSNNDDGPSSAAVDRDFDFQISQITVDSAGSSPATPDQVKIRFGAVAYSNDLGVEANNPTMSEEIKMSIEDASRYFESSAANTFLGNVVTVNIPTAQMTTFSTATNVDKIRWYVAFMDEGTDNDYTFRLMAETDKDVQTYEVPYTYEQLRALTLRETGIGEYTALGNVRYAAAFNAWMVWLIPGATSNIKHSAVALPYTTAQETDNADPDAGFVDPFRANTFTLADNYADEGVWGGQMGRSFVVLGREAAYAQTGDTPITLSPPKRIAGSYGVFGPSAACRWKDESGRSAIVYLDKTGERLWMITAYAASDTENDERIFELTYPVRGLIKSKLFSGTVPTAQTDKDDVRLVPDFRNDRLLLWYRNNCVVIDKKVFGRKYRPIVFWTFTAPSVGLTFRKPVADFEYGFRSLVSDGSMKELFHLYAAGAFTAQSGALADGGSARPTCYFKTGKFDSVMRRATRAYVSRPDVADVITIVSNCSYANQTPSQTITVAANRDFGRFHGTQKGQDIQYTVTIPDSSDGIVKCIIYEEPLHKGVRY